MTTLRPTLCASLVATVVMALSGESNQIRSHNVPPPTEYPIEAEYWSLSPESAEVLLGDRLFFETRFAQFFFDRSEGDVNVQLRGGDPVVEDVASRATPVVPGPFRGRSMNCRQCHLGNDLRVDNPLAQRTYCDFSRRSRIPRRNDGLTLTVRNSPPMIGLGLPREVPMLLHSDGEFASIEDLVVGTLVGRNFGWLPEEATVAASHISRVIRDDNGLINPRHFRDHRGAGVPYRIAMLGTDPSLPPYLRIPPPYRINVAVASDADILHAVGRLMDAYTRSLRFGTNNTLRNAQSPFDLFLEKNDLPSWPKSGELASDYANRLLKTIEWRPQLIWVTSADGQFRLHRQPYQFGETELEGLKIFLTRDTASKSRSAGNCVSCHPPPAFTDYSLHNTGVSQADYDAVFGEGSFAALRVPGLSRRNANFDAYLPSSLGHPRASNRFRSMPSASMLGFADLGVWNVYANPDVPGPQAALTQILCGPRGPARGRCAPETILPLTIGYFKTPSVRDLGHSDPYCHSGRLDTIEDILRFYDRTSRLARAGRLRNGSPEVSGIKIDGANFPALSAFLKSLNEDYE